METIKLTQEQTDFIKSTATQLFCSDGSWYYMPFWFKEVGDNTFNMVQFEDLPDGVKNAIKEIRDKDLSRDQLMALIRGTQISYHDFDHPLVVKGGHSYSDQYGIHRWYSLSGLTKTELLELYNVCGNSK